MIDLATGRRNRVPVAQLVRRTLREIEPHARELGSERELEGDPRDPRARQRLRPAAPVFNANRDIVEVVREIAAATEEATQGDAAAYAASGSPVSGSSALTPDEPTA